MTNFQESDSIAEKPEVVKTKAKSNRWNWKTATIGVVTACAVTIAGFFAVNPKILNAAEPPPVTTQPVTPPSPPPASTPPAGKRVPKGGWIYWVLIALEIAANAITIKNELTGEVDQVDVENNRPRDKSVTIEARPEISLSYAKKESSIWNHGHDAGESGGLHEEWRPESEAYENRGWYASYEYSGNVVVWDEDSERYQFRDTYNTIISGKGWMPKIHWNALVNLPSSADPNPDYDYANDPASEAYLRAGVYYIRGKSTVHVYGPVTVTSKPQTPQLSRSGVDASLSAAAKKENLRYTAKVWYDTRKLTWVPGKDARYDQGGHKGHWSDGAWQNNQDRATNPIPSWENYEEDLNICEMYHQVRAEAVYGGIDVWWHKNIHRETLTISRVPSNNPNATPIVQNNVPFKRTEWIVDDRVLSNNYADYETN